MSLTKFRISLLVGTSIVGSAAALPAMAADAPAPAAWEELLTTGDDAVAAIGQELVAMRDGTTTDLARTPSSFLGPYHVCVTPGTPDEVVARINEFMIKSWQASNQEGDFGERYVLGTRWSGGSFGTTGDPIDLTWSFVGNGVSIPGGVGEPTSANVIFSTFDAAFAGLGGRATWVTQFVNSFGRWQALTGVDYTRITVGGNDWDDNAAWGAGYAAGLRGHVRIGAHPIDGSSGILAYNAFPQNGDMVLDSNDIGNFDSTVNTYRFLRNTVMHEHGHGAGFNHVCSTNSNQLMEPTLNTAFDGPQQDDIRGFHRYYGDINEPDNISSQAVFAGNLGIGTITLGTVPPPNVTFGSTLSIDANGEVDYHKVTTAQVLLANFTLNPVSSTYSSTSQSNCSSTSNINALAMANLAMDIVATNGATVIQSASAGAIGISEQLNGVLLSPPGDFYVRIYETDAPTQTQLYNVTFQGTTVPSIAASDGTSNAHVAVSWTNIPNNTGYNLFRNTTNNRATAALLASPGTNSHNDTTAVPLQTYFYWIEAVQGAGGASRPVAGPDSGFRAAPPDQPGPFNLLLPADGSGGVSLTPTLTWSPSANAATYTVIIDDTSGLGSPISTVPGVVGTSYAIPGGLLQQCTTYYWGVRAVNPNGSTNSTPVQFSFTTRSPADFDGDGFVTGVDYDLYVLAFEAGDMTADFDGDGFITGVDFDLYVAAFENAC